jgi:LPXTG-motif cell wall-anchored protein
MTSDEEGARQSVRPNPVERRQRGGQVSGKRASTRTAGVAAATVALVLGLFAASAVGWYDEQTPPEATTPTETTPTETTPTETTTTDTTPAEVAPIVEETLPLSPQPEVAGTAAPQPEVEPVPALTSPRDEQVKGEFGTRDEGGAGGAKPTVLAQATEAPAGNESSGQLAQTGFDVLLLAILGGVALAGSGLLFWRSRTA